MDYEKKYKEALERAKNLMAMYPQDAPGYKEVFPELAESEDERIRKEIISALKFANDGGVYDKHITYLEKQKEQEEIPLMNGDVDLYFDEWNQQNQNPTKRQCFEEGMKYAQRLQKEQKPNIEICPHSIKSKSYSENPITSEMMDKAADECIWNQCDDNRFWIIEKAKEDIITKTNIESSPDEMKVLDNFLFRCWQMGWLSKYDVIVPEQKPVEIHIDNPNIHKLDPNVVVETRTNGTEYLSPDCGTTAGVWSEEDEEMLEHIEEMVNFCYCNHFVVDAETSNRVRKWLWARKSWPKREWDEVDRKNIETLITALPKCTFRHPPILERDECRDLIAWLKSLRPQKLDASKLENFDPVEVLNKIKTEWPMAWEKVVGKQEWDEFDEDCLKRAIWYVENPAPSVVKDTNLALWLKSLPERYSIQPKKEVEWSEEEKKDLVHILKVLDDCYIYGRHDLSKTDYDNLTSTLESLRPAVFQNGNTHWKPSEEQMLITAAEVGCIVSLDAQLREEYPDRETRHQRIAEIINQDRKTEQK